MKKGLVLARGDVCLWVVVTVVLLGGLLIQAGCNKDDGGGTMDPVVSEN